MLLRVKHLTVFYEKAKALDDVSLEVIEGSIVTIIGANGAGKSTVLRVISGLTRISSGEIWFEDNNIQGFQTPEIVRFGIIHIPKGRQLFPFLSVSVNLQLGASARKDKDAIDEDLERVFTSFRHCVKGATNRPEP